MFNQFTADADAFVDIKFTQSDLSRAFPPERRLWVHLEPVLLTDYFRGFEQYYQGGILSWHMGLEKLPQTVAFRHGRVGGGSRDSDRGKRFGFGGHISAKNNPEMEGYRFRNQILDRQNEILIPSTIYNYRRSWHGISHDYPRDSTDDVMDYMFHLAIENNRETRYATEKIVRACANMSVPLYYGDPKIDEIFDPRGIIFIDEESWLDTINRLTPDDYFKRMEFVRKNYFRSTQYWDMLDRIAAGIMASPAANYVRNNKHTLIDSIPQVRSTVGLNQTEQGYEIVSGTDDQTVAKCNDAAAFVFSHCDGGRSIGDIAQIIASNNVSASISEISSDVQTIVRVFVKNRFLDLATTSVSPTLVPTPVKGLSLQQSGNVYSIVGATQQTVLNPSAAIVFSLCDGVNHIIGIADKIIELLETNTDSSLSDNSCNEIITDVYRTILRFADRGLLSIRAERGRANHIDRSRFSAGRPDRVKPKVLFILTRFPQVSETYIKTEIMALRDIYDIHVVAFEDSNLRYQNHHPYRLVGVNGDTMSDDLHDQSGELRRLIEEVNPDIIHTHYLNNVQLVGQLAEQLGIPYTVRAHSYDVMAREFRHHEGSSLTKPRQFVVRAAPYINREECLGVLTFPYTLPVYDMAGVNPDKVTSCYPVVDFSAFYDRSPNQIGMLNVEPCLPKKAVADFIDLGARFRDSRFSLYGMGHRVDLIKEHNQSLGSPVEIFDPVEPEEMPSIYKQHNWLVYTSSFQSGNLGWPLAVFEAQAAGLGVCLANVHPHTADQLGGAGFTYDSLDEAAAIISKPYPDEMRELGFDNARKADIFRHRHLLTDLWNDALNHEDYSERTDEFHRDE
ncbi:MAG: hypothetical protein DHS20C01_33760 [marine bacterium B5-7]|nr:MAG: hypothetical protein DHS20C01_33760 [marine bacterium B5-7]